MSQFQAPIRLYVPVGLPGCGKSTFGFNIMRSPGSGIVHATDEIRAELGDVNDMSNNKRVFELWHERIAESLDATQDVYADATNLDARSRNTLRDIAASCTNVEVHCFLFTNVKEAIIRNSQRSRRVPDDVMLRFIYKLEDCLETVPREPFTSVTRIDGVSGVSPYAAYL